MHLVETVVACYRLSGRSAYHVHTIIRLTTAASLTHGAAQPREPLSTESSCRVVRVGPHATPSEACSEARKMGRRTATSCDEGVSRFNPIRRENPDRRCPSPSAGSVGRPSAFGVPTFSMRQIRHMIALLRPLHQMEDLLQGKSFQRQNLLQQPPHLRHRKRWGFFSPNASSHATEKNGPTYTSAYGDATPDICAVHSGPYLTRFWSLQNPVRWPTAPHSTRQTRAEAYSPAHY